MDMNMRLDRNYSEEFYGLCLHLSHSCRQTQKKSSELTSGATIFTSSTLLVDSISQKPVAKRQNEPQRFFKLQTVNKY